MNIIEKINRKTLEELETEKNDLDDKLKEIKKINKKKSSIFNFFNSPTLIGDEFIKKNIERNAIDIAIFKKYGSKNISNTERNTPFYKEDREIKIEIEKYEKPDKHEMLDNYNPTITFSKRKNGGKHKLKDSNNKKTKKRGVNKNRKTYKK
jgi:hypothetical protein